MRIAACLALVAAAPSLAAEKRYAIKDFDRVQVFGPFGVEIRTGRATSVTASGDAQALDMVSVVSSGGVLTIQTLTKARSAWKDDPTAPPRLVVVLPQLKSVRLLGSGTISAAEVRGLATEITLNGSGQVSVARLTADNATVRMNGSGRITLAGTAKTLTVDMSGSGDLDATRLAATDTKIVSATSGRVALNATRTASVKQTGAGEVQVGGSPSCLVENLGIGTARCGN